jgi:hypothetical protein
VTCLGQPVKKTEDSEPLYSVLITDSSCKNNNRMLVSEWTDKSSSHGYNS